MANNIHRIFDEAFLKRWEPCQEIGKIIFQNLYSFVGVNWPPKWSNITKMVNCFTFSERGMQREIISWQKKHHGGAGD